MALADYIGKYWAGAEVMYGVIIAMTFTSVVRGYPIVFDVILNKIITAALMCCAAWGIADGLFYVWERNYIINQENRIIQFSKSAPQNESAVSLIGDQLDDSILRNIPRDTRHQLYEKLTQFLSTVDRREKLTLHEAIIIILGTYIRSAAAGIIVVTPFFIVDNVENALKVSNLLGIFLLFCVGYFRSMDKNVFSKVMFGLGSSLIGVIIVVITIVLGG